MTMRNRAPAECSRVSRIAGVNVSFFQWMMLGVPVVVLMFACLFLYFRLGLLRTVALDAGKGGRFREELRRLGPLSPGQRNTLVAFGLTVMLWLLPGVLNLIDAAAGRESSFARAYAAALPE